MSLMAYIPMSRTGIIMRKKQVTSEETKRKIGEGNKGKVISEESRKKISDSTKGRIPWNKDKKGVMPEPWNKGKEHMHGENHPMFGKHPSEETLKRMSESHKNHRVSEETKRKMSEARKGRAPWNNGLSGYRCGPCSEETKQKIGNANRGRVVSEETRQRLSKAGMGNPSRTGQHASEEEKKKMSDARTGEKNAMYSKHHSEETKSKIAKKAMGREVSVETRRKMGESRSGEKNPAWNNGSSFEPYCYKFNDKLKESIRDRDDRTCQLCGEKENGRKLSVHHIHYQKDDCDPDLISLCNRCNIKANTNRDYWETLFMSKLKERGLIV